MAEERARLGLGTAQLGMAYGISRGGAGPVPPGEVRAVLERAAALDVAVLDTAPAYGESERLLGELAADLPELQVVTKTEVGEGEGTAARTAQGVVEGLERSLERLRRPSVYGLLVHRPEDLLGARGPACHGGLVAAREKGLVRRIGASVQSPEQLAGLLDRYPLDLIQAPLNVFDQRLLRAGWPERLRARGIELHARSPFLQRLLLMDEEALPPALRPLAPALARFRDRARSHGQTPLEAALGFALSRPGVDVVLCGVHGLGHLEEIAAAATAAGGDDGPTHWCAGLAVDDPAWVDPSRWPEAAS